MKQITYVTGNSYKFNVAKEFFKDTNIELIQHDIETPEIQSTDVREIASFSAKWAAKELNRPVIVTDGGFYILALKGFPGPFIKYINKWLSDDDILRLMDGVEDRSIEVRECIAYCEPEKEPVTFHSILKGSIAKIKGKPGKTSINSLFIPDGFDRTESEISENEMIEFWKGFDYWEKLKNELTKD
jgi:non-canonical purine NTP pyrophosphatase (RdgB/HAM1 family)